MHSYLAVKVITQHSSSTHFVLQAYNHYIGIALLVVHCLLALRASILISTLRLRYQSLLCPKALGSFLLTALSTVPSLKYHVSSACSTSTHDYHLTDSISPSSSELRSLAPTLLPRLCTHVLLSLFSSFAPTRGISILNFI